MIVLSVTGISKRSERGIVLNEISFVQTRFQKIAIAGETGSGKSTLMKIVAGLIQPDAGVVVFENEKVLGPEEKLIPGHPGIAYLSQHFELRNNYRVEELLDMASKVPGEEAELIYEVCQIKHLLKRKTNQLSGGEKQRIAAARLLVASPKLLLLDEPYSNLDMVHKQVLKSVIHDIAERLQITCIMISHDPHDTLSWADEILVMKDGQIIQKGTPMQVYHEPIDKYAAGLFGEYNLIEQEQVTLLCKAIPVVEKGKTLFSRPEDFIVAHSTEPGAYARVTKVRFFGSYYELDVLFNQVLITVKTNKDNFVEGDAVDITLHRHDHWFM